MAIDVLALASAKKYTNSVLTTGQKPCGTLNAAINIPATASVGDWYTCNFDDVGLGIASGNRILFNTTTTYVVDTYAIKGANGADGLNGSNGADGLNGSNGADGLNGSNGADGLNGSNGADGVSPTAEVTAITGGHTVAITDKNGTQSFNVLDGDGNVLDGSVTMAKLDSNLSQYVTKFQKTVWSPYSGLKEVLVDQAYKLTSTTIQSRSGFITWKIAVTPGEEYKITSRVNKYSATPIIVFVDSVNTKISTLYNSTDDVSIFTNVVDGNTLYMVNKDFTIPVGVSYMYCTSDSTYTAFDILSKSVTNTLQDELDKNTLSKNILTKNNKISVDEIEDLGEFSPSTKIGNMITELSARSGGSSKKYSCVSGDKFYYTGKANHTYGYVFFYTENGALLSTSMLQTGVIETFSEKEVIIPEYCYFVVFFSFDKTSYPLNIKKLSKLNINMTDYDNSINTINTNISNTNINSDFLRKDIMLALDTNRIMKNTLDWTLKPRTKGSLYICVDDTQLDIDISAAVVCGEYNMPLCFAASPVKVNQNVIGISTYNTTAEVPLTLVGTTVKNVWDYVISHGGELLNHYGKPCFTKSSIVSSLTKNDMNGHTPAETLAKYNELSGTSYTMEEMAESMYQELLLCDECTCLDIFEDAYEMFAKKKYELESYGYKIRGCIQPGGTTRIAVFSENGYNRDMKAGGDRSPEADKWVKMYYDYCDYWGAPKDGVNPYREIRGMSVGKYFTDGVLNETLLRTDLENLYISKGWKGAYWHNVIWDGFSVANMRQFLTVLQEFVTAGKIDVTTPAKYHDDYLMTKMYDFETRIAALEV